MQMNRRDAIKTITIGSAALMAARLTSLAADAGTSDIGLKYPYSLPDLPYGYDALSEFIDPETMTIHHTKHHAAYIKNLNAALETADAQYRDMTLNQLLSGAEHLPESLRTAVINQGGGHANHTLFWTILTPESGGKPDGTLAELIDAQFGSQDACIDALRKSAMSVFGSGWAWLSYSGGNLVVESSPNQNSPLMSGHIPLLGIDVWEHAYYLKYQNRRADYVSGVLGHINWATVGANLAAAV